MLFQTYWKTDLTDNLGEVFFPTAMPTLYPVTHDKDLKCMADRTGKSGWIILVLDSCALLYGDSNATLIHCENSSNMCKCYIHFLVKLLSDY